MTNHHYTIVLPFSAVSGCDTPEEIARLASHHAKSRKIEVYVDGSFAWASK